MISATQSSSESTNITAMPFEFKLSDSNFKVRLKMMKLYVAGLGKLGYLTVKTPHQNDVVGRKTVLFWTLIGLSLLEHRLPNLIRQMQLHMQCSS